MRNSLVTIIMIFGLALTGCKEQVSFNAVEDQERSGSNGPIDPVDPGEPTDPDGLAPVVKMIQEPVDHLYGEETDAVFEVIKGDHEIESVSCYINKEEIPCNWEKGYVLLSELPMGKHQLQIVAEDVEGLKGDTDALWEILDHLRPVSENLKVDQARSETDILFVIDNSSSMRSEQRKISQRFDRFIEQIRGLNWHIGITTTDPRNNQPWNDGKLHQFPNRDDFLTPALGEKEAQKLFAKHVKRKESGWDTEVGIYATYRTIERYVEGRKQENRVLRRFYRPDAALAVVLVSDEDESRDGEKNKGNNLIKLVKDTWGQNKVFQFNSIIVHTQECLNGEGNIMGHKYERLSRKTNGIVGDICANNYSEILKDLGKGVANLQKVHELGCVAQDRDGDGRVDVKVTSKNGSPIPGFTVDQSTVTFDTFLNPDNYTFKYYCLVN